MFCNRETTKAYTKDDQRRVDSFIAAPSFLLAKLEAGLAPFNACTQNGRVGTNRANAQNMQKLKKLKKGVGGRWRRGRGGEGTSGERGGGGFIVTFVENDTISRLD